MARVKIQITTPSNNVIKVSPGVSALSSVQLYLNELIDVNTQHGADGYVLTQQADGTFAMEAVATTLADLSDTDISNPQGGDSLVYDANAQKWVPGGVKSVNGQDGDVIISIPSPPPTPGVSGLADTNITNLQDNQIIRYDSASGNWLNEDLEALPAGGTTGQALVKASNTDYDVAWDDIAVDVQFHQRYATEAETLRSGATETVELYFFAQGDGNGLAESASSDTPTSGFDIQRKLYYAEKAQADPNTSGDWTQFTAIADNTTFANAKTALLAYLKERTGGTVPISLKMTWEEVAQAPAFVGLLNESYGSGAEAAYSTRRLNGNVTDCMVIRRASDSTTQTIGFVDGNIDEAAIETFCTGTTCTVYQWLDQSGNGNTATAASGNEPTIYTGGALVKEKGRLALDDGYFSIPNAPITAAPISLAMVAVHTDGTNKNMWNANEQGTNTNYFYTRSDANNTFDAAIYGGGFVRSRADVDAGQFLGFAEFLTSGSNITAQTFIDGGTGATLVSTTPPTGIDVNDLGQFQRASTAFYSCNNMQELVIWNSDKSSVRTSIESNIGDYFTQNTPLLDTYSGAAAAYSLRLLSSSYSGALVEVYNGSSYADIGANVFGELDTVALAAHCGSNNGFVSKWYDQSGNTNTATQTTTANMPKIYDGTTGVVTENGKPVVQWDTTATDFLTMQTALTSVQSVFHVSSSTNTITRYIPILGDATHADYHSSTANKLLASGAAASYVLNGDNYINGVSKDYTTTNKPTTQSILTLIHTEASGRVSQLTRDRNLTPRSWDGNIQEILIYESDQSSNRTNIEDNINTFYSIY